LPQACLVACHNYKQHLSAEEETKLSQLKWSICNLFSNGRTSLEGDKYNKWRCHQVGSIINANLCMNCDERNVLACLIKKTIFSVAPFTSSDGSSKITIEMHIPIDGDIARSSHYRLEMKDNYELYYYKNRRHNIREDVNIKKLVEDKQAIIVQFYGIHYQAIVLENEESYQYEWPSLERHDIFSSSLNHKLCPLCNKLTYTSSPTVECSLCKLWVHCHEGSSCLKYWDGIDTEEMSTNFYCSVCLDILVSYQRSTGEVCCIESIINCLRSFNLEDAEVRDDEEIEILNVVIGNIIQN